MASASQLPRRATRSGAASRSWCAVLLSRLHADDRAMVQQTLDRMIADGIGCDMTKRIVRAAGELRVIRLSGFRYSKMTS
jgi:hypothetical protein